MRTRRYTVKGLRPDTQVTRLEGAYPQFTYFKAEKRVHVGFPMFGPWYLAHRSWFYGFGPWYRIYFSPGLDPLYWLLMVLYDGVNKGLAINREGDHLENASLQIEYLKIWNIGLSV